MKMITEDYVSFETAKLLKEKWFREWCSYCYGLDVRYKGESIDQDEEIELKEQGYGDELEYVDGGRLYHFGCDNRNEGSPYATPSLYVAIKWLRETQGLNIYVRGVWKDVEVSVFGDWEPAVVGYEWFIESLTDDTYSKTSTEQFLTYEQACEAAIKYCLEKLV